MKRKKYPYSIPLSIITYTTLRKSSMDVCNMVTRVYLHVMSTKPIKVERKTKVLNHKSHTWANIQKWVFWKKSFFLCLLFLFFLYLQIHNFEIVDEEKVFQYNRKHTNVVWMLKPGSKIFRFVCFMILFQYLCYEKVWRLQKITVRCSRVRLRVLFELKMSFHLWVFSFYWNYILLSNYLRQSVM